MGADTAEGGCRLSVSPFTAEWGDEIRGEPHPEGSRPPPAPELAPVQIVEDGFYWFSFNSPSGHPGHPVMVNGPYYYVPKSTQPYVVEKAIRQLGGVFTPIYPPVTVAFCHACEVWGI